MQPAPAGFIPGLSFAASIGLVVGCSVAALLIFLLLTYLACIREDKIDYVPKALPVAIQQDITMKGVVPQSLKIDKFDPIMNDI